METVSFAGNIIQAALGLGLVIVIHELGHFLLAKWNGVKVEVFSIGFGPPIISYRKGVGARVGAGPKVPADHLPEGWGETEYLLAYIPLGGYVKMLGESPEESDPDSKASSDPRAYNKKSVWARMQIITAGVIMNLILGWACFSLVYGRGGMPDQPAKIGGVLPGSPAYKAGLLAGDEIVAIDGRGGVGYKDLVMRVNMSGAGQKLRFDVRRPGVKDELTFEIEPLRESSNVAPTIGVLIAHGLELYHKTPVQAPPGMEVPPERPNPGFEGGDKVVAVGAEGGPLEPVEEEAELARKLDALRKVPVVFEVERKGTKEEEAPATRAKVTVPPHHLLDLGLRLTPGPVAAIRPDSPAAKAGLKEGDRIEQVDGNPDYDPMGLPDYARDHSGSPIKLTIVRASQPSSPRLEVEVTPDASPAWSGAVDLRPAPLDVPGLGLALAIDPKVKEVTDGSPAAKAGLKAGDTLTSMILTPARAEGDEDRPKPKPVTIKLEDRTGGWPTAFTAIQELPTASLELTTDRSEKPIKVTPEVDRERFFPTRGLALQHLVRKLPPLGLPEALSRGWEETVDNVLTIFKMFRGMYQRRISSDNVGGLIPIVQIAYQAASAGWRLFVHFIGMLSISLAVLNFLPIPPLDGGQFTLLAIEKIRGKPLPDSAQNTVTIAGLIFVLGLIVLVNGRDLIKLVSGYFGG